MRQDKMSSQTICLYPPILPAKEERERGGGGRRGVLSLLHEVMTGIMKGMKE